jgi:hypothetical protein
MKMERVVVIPTSTTAGPAAETSHGRAIYSHPTQESPVSDILDCEIDNKEGGWRFRGERHFKPQASVPVREEYLALIMREKAAVRQRLVEKNMLLLLPRP